MSNQRERHNTLSGDEYREKIISEIIETETSYVTSLHICIVYYFEKLQTCSPPILTQKQIQNIFLYFDQVFFVNQAFLQDLQSYRLQHTLSHSIGEAFQRFIPYLRVYYQYIGNSDIALHTLQDLEKSVKVDEFLTQLRLQIPFHNQLDLRGYLIMPVQRLPRYNLLLKDLLKRTPSTFSDFPRLSSAYDEMKKLTDYVNRSIIATERRLRLFAIEDRISGFSGKLVEPHRHFIKEGTLLKVCRKKYKTTDILIYGIGDDKNMCVSQVCDLALVVVKDISERSFELLTDTKSFVVHAASKEIKEEWIEEIRRAADIEAASLRANKRMTEGAFIKPLFVPDNEVALCMNCKKVFNITRRRHHCHYLYLPSSVLVRCCDSCTDKRLFNVEQQSSNGDDENFYINEQQNVGLETMVVLTNN
ncbi:Rho/RAC guanine nucleotide exchange factor [Entamoeba marina]